MRPARGRRKGPPDASTNHADRPRTSERAAEQVDVHLPAERPVEAGNTPILLPSPKPEQPPPLADLWQDTLIGLRLRLPRKLYGTCLRQATLLSCADGVATIGVGETRFKDTLERGYLATLRFALGDVLRKDVTVRVVTSRLG